MKTVNISDFAKYVGLSLLSKELSVSHLKLQKIIYYCQAWHMVFFGRENTLLDEKPQAWVNGPVYPTIYKEYKKEGSFVTDLMTKEDFGTEDIESALEDLTGKLNFSVEQTKCLNSVISLYGVKNEAQLISYTHCEKPWAEKREGLLPFQRSTKELSLDTMYNYYKTRRDSQRKSKRNV